MAEIIAHRALWAAVFLFLILLVTGRAGKLKQALPIHAAPLTCGQAVLVTVNWTSYLYAAETNQLVQSVWDIFVSADGYWPWCYCVG